MKDEEWFAKWEEDLPSPDELMPLTQNLITPDLAAAFKIHSPPESLSVFPHQTQHNHQPQHNHRPEVSKRLGEAEEEESSVGGGGGSGGAGGGGGGGGEEPARTLKRPRLVWTPQLHKRFVDAVAHLGIKNAVPKTIMQLMNVEGLTRENVASHLQKYRLYLKRMQGLSSEGPSSCDHLFASTPVPPSHFLHRDDMMLPLVSMPHMPSAPHYATFDPRFLSGLPRQPPPPAPPPQRMAMAPSPSASGFTRGEYVMVDDLSTVSSVAPPRQVLTLFPNSDN